MTDKAVQQPDEGVVERDALLFRAGSYPDRDIEITEEDLDRMIEGYTPAPIKVEHTDTPLRFGVVTRIWRVGRELFGRLAFNPLAWALARECGATRLSVAVRRDKTGLREVSLVRSPRIADAAVFGGGCQVSGDGCQESDGASYLAGDDLAENSEQRTVNSEQREGGVDRPEGPTPALTETGRGQRGENPEARGGEGMDNSEQRTVNSEQRESGTAEEQPVEFGGRVAALETELRLRDVDAKIDDLKRRGKLAPAAEAFARSLLMADDEVVVFAEPPMIPLGKGDGSSVVAIGQGSGCAAEITMQVAKTFEAFLEAQPKVIEFSELTPGATGDKPAFSSEDERLFEKLGVTSEAVAAAGDR